MSIIHPQLNQSNLASITSPIPNHNIICYSGFFYKTNPDKLSNWIATQMSSSSSISNLKKKQAIQSILSHLNLFLENNQKNQFSIQFFLEPSQYQIFYLSNTQEELINEFYNKDLLYDRDTYELDFWDDFYFNNDFLSIFEIKKERIQTHLFTQTKYKEKEIFTIEEIQEKITKYKPLFCLKTNENSNSTLFNKIPNTIISIFDFSQNKFKNQSLHKKLIETKDAFQLENNLKLLSKKENEFNKNPDLFIFGNEIIRGIKNYEVKEVFCYSEFRDKIEGKVDKEFLNFNWFIFPNDKNSLIEYPQLQFLQQYKGIFAVKYFVC